MADNDVYLPALLKKFQILLRIKTFSWMKMRRKTKLFSNDNEEIALPDLNEPNFNEMKDLKPLTKDICSLTL